MTCAQINYVSTRCMFDLFFRQLDEVISNLSKNFAEGTEYFKVIASSVLKVFLHFVPLTDSKV